MRGPDGEELGKWKIFGTFALSGPGSANRKSEMSEKQSCRGTFLALTPLLVFMACYLSVSLLAGDFYKMPISVAFVAASVYAVALMRGMPFAERIGRFSSGASDPNVMLMIWIFVLAGAFAESARSMGAVDATVDLTLHLLPGRLLPAGLFLASCFISLSVGTSVGTIVALVPVAAGLSSETGMNEAWLTAIVVGGAFFGDNLSFISDTTIAATRTQECDLRDKFRVNVRIVAPAAVVTLLVYLLTGSGADAVVAPGRVEWVGPCIALPACAGNGHCRHERIEGAPAGHRRLGRDRPGDREFRPARMVRRHGTGHHRHG